MLSATGKTTRESTYRRYLYLTLGVMALLLSGALAGSLAFAATPGEGAPGAAPAGVRAGAPAGIFGGTATPTACPDTFIVGAITANDPVSSGAYELDGTPSECDDPQSCPPIASGSFHYDAYTYTNSDSVTRCIFVTVYGHKCGEDFEGVLSAAYLGSFDPNSICTNYLADPDDYSDPFTGPMSYSFEVPAGRSFVVLVEEDQEGLGCQNYTLIIDGLPECPMSTATPMPTLTPPGTSTAVATSTASPISTAVSTGTAVGTSVATSTANSTPGVSTQTATVVATITSTPCAISFSDVPSGSTFYPFVRCLACRGILGGYSDGTFRPGNPMTRGQLAKVVSNAAGFSEAHTRQTFQDVPEGSTFHIFIERLASRDIIGGYACGGSGEPCVGPENKPYFRPNTEVTRGQTAKIVAIAALLPDPPSGSRTFEDVSTLHTFYRWIERMALNGIIGGYPCGGPGEPCGAGSRPYFRFGNNVTRGQASKIVSNTFFPACSP
ncbi:MAG TPA: S-layer homology domain-containing protein [Chloroflexia bacterium]|nr:S-layer homology domain-containing protein [Chloroflexia bacterium]